MRAVNTALLMRTFLSLATLLVVVLLIGIIAKKQLTSISVPAVSAAGTSASGPSANTSEPPARQLQQFKQDLDQAMRQAPRRIDEQ